MNEYVKNIVETPFSDGYTPRHQNGPDYIIPTNDFRTWQIDGAVSLYNASNVEEEWKPISLVTQFNKTAEDYANRQALLVKRNGSWVTWTWADYRNDVVTAAKGFIKLGLLPYHGAAILGFNAPEWCVSYWAAIFAGAFGVGIYSSNSPEACFHILNDSLCNVVVVEDDHQLQKILQIRDTLPQLKAIIQYTGKPSQPDVLSWQDLLLIGRSVPDDILTQRIKGIAINQCCTIVYTSGTTGNAKGVMLSHDSLLTTVRTVTLNSWRSVKAKENQLSYLPLSHIAATITDLVIPTQTVACLYFASPDVLKGKLAQNLTQARPHIFLGVPRVFEKISEALADVETRMEGFKRNIFRWARKQALNHHLQPNGSSESISFLLAKKLVINKVKHSIGLDRAKRVFAGAAPLTPEVQKFFFSLDICLMQAFGLSECTGVGFMDVLGTSKMGACGKQDSMPNFESKILSPDEDGIGEVLLRGRNICMGYLNNEEKTLETIDNDRWLHTGDTGKFDNEGYFFITGRLKELVITSGGENIPPVHIEIIIKRLIPAVSNCMVVGDGRKFLTLLITFKTLVNLDTMASLDQLTPVSIAWCRSVGSNAETVSEIISKKDGAVFKAIQLAIAEYNDKEAISHPQRLQKWRIIPQDFSIPTGELTPTSKMKRPFIATKYANVINQMYSDLE